MDEALSNFAREHQLGEYNFNGRNAADNVAAIEKAGQAPPPNPGRVNPPPSARHALDIIAARTAQMLKDYAAMARAKDPLYFHDTHYDRYTTNLWAKSLGDAISKGPE